MQYVIFQSFSQRFLVAPSMTFLFAPSSPERAGFPQKSLSCPICHPDSLNKGRACVASSGVSSVVPCVLPTRSSGPGASKHRNIQQAGFHKFQGSLENQL